MSTYATLLHNMTTAGDVTELYHDGETQAEALRDVEALRSNGDGTTLAINGDVVWLLGPDADGGMVRATIFGTYDMEALDDRARADDDEAVLALIARVDDDPMAFLLCCDAFYGLGDLLLEVGR